MKARPALTHYLQLHWGGSGSGGCATVQQFPEPDSYPCRGEIASSPAQPCSPKKRLAGRPGHCRCAAIDFPGIGRLLRP